MAVGGLVGWNFEIVSAGYAAGDSLVCGLAGWRDRRATNSYAAGNSTTSHEAGGPVGDSRRRIERPILSAGHSVRRSCD